MASASITIDRFGHINGIAPNKLWMHPEIPTITDAELRLSQQRYYDPHLSAVRQGCVAMIDYRERHVLDQERKAERMEDREVSEGRAVYL